MPALGAQRRASAASFVEALEAGLLTADEDGFVRAADDDVYDAFVAARNPGYPIEAEASPRR